MQPRLSDIVSKARSENIVYELPVTFDARKAYFDVVKEVRGRKVPNIVYYIVNGKVKMKECWISKEEKKHEPQLIIYDTDSERVVSLPVFSLYDEEKRKKLAICLKFASKEMSISELYF